MTAALVEALLLLAASVAAVAVFQRARLPSSLAYLLVGALVGPHAAGLVANPEIIRAFAELGIVFLLFAIGLNFALPQIYALRHLVLGLGSGQVLLTTALIGAAATAFGAPVAAAFAIGAAFAQSSATLIVRQLADQDEDHTRHGRLAIAMSVFQDVTAAPIVVIVPVLGAAAAGSLAAAIASALVKAAAAFALIYFAGRWLLRPLFHAIAQRRSAEPFTLTVPLVSLTSAAATQSLGLSLAFGAFLAGMMLGETEFRPQIESSTRPFRDVLLGLFFVSLGMLIDPRALPQVWHLALAAAAGLLTVKSVLVAALVRAAGIETVTAWRTGVALAVGGEFGLAVLAIALEAGIVDAPTVQVALTAVLFSMIAGPFFIRHDRAILRYADRRGAPAAVDAPQPDAASVGPLRDHVVVTAITRQGRRQLAPGPDTRVEADDVLVLFGAPEDLERAEARLLG
ncbi:MAG: hypothetical protein OHK0044_29810 [Burkholderiaceae bacterium]